MKVMKTWRLALMLIISLVAYSAPSQAALISFTDSWSLSDSISWGGDASSRSENFYRSSNVNFSLFDAGLGVLNSVTFSFTNMSMTSSANSNYDDNDWFSETEGVLRLSSARMYVNNGLVGGLRNFYVNNRVDSCYDESLGSGSSCSTALGTQTQSTSSVNVQQNNASLLASLIGTGTRSLSIFLGGNLFSDEIDGDDGYVDFLSGNLSGRGDFTVTYDYTEREVDVPEPPTLALLCLGILGLLVAKRRQLS